jgi:hypothetical protein
VNNPFPALAATLYKFGVIDQTPPANSTTTSPTANRSNNSANQWISALLAQNPAKMPIRFAPEAAPDKPENAALHTAAQKALHYTVNALLFNLENNLNRPELSDHSNNARHPAQAPGQNGSAEAILLNDKEEAALYWLANQLLLKSITRTLHPIFTYRDDNGEIKRQKHYNHLNSCIKRLRGVITASRLGDQTARHETAQAIDALHIPKLPELVTSEEAEWREKARTEQYNEIFLDLNNTNPFNPSAEASLPEPLNEPDRTQPSELEGFLTPEIIHYHAAKRQYQTNPQLNNLQAWTLAQASSNLTPALEQTKRYVCETTTALLEKAEQTPGVGFQLPEARWSNRTYALPQALRRIYAALEKQNQDLTELDPAPELLHTLQHEHFSFGIAKACHVTGFSYKDFKLAWDKQIALNPNLIQTATRPEAILKVLKQIAPDTNSFAQLRFLEEFAVTGGYAIEISPRQQQYREQISDILANTVSEIQLELLAHPSQPNSQNPNAGSPHLPQRGTALEPVLRTPVSSILRRELETNVRTLLKKELETDLRLKESLQEIKKTSADFRDGTYIAPKKAQALDYILLRLADSPESIQTSPPVLIPPGTQFYRNLEYLVDHVPGFKHLKEEELTGAALAYLQAKKKPEKDYCLGLAEHGEPELTRKLQCQVDQAIVFLQRDIPISTALAQARAELALLTTPAHQLTYDQRLANRDFFAGLARASTLWRNKTEQEQYRVPQKGYSTLKYASNLAQNRLTNEFYQNKLPFSAQMQTDLLVLGLNILEKWKHNPVAENNPKRHLASLSNLSAKLAQTLQVDSVQAQEDAQRGLNLPEIILEKTEQAIFQFLRAESFSITQETLQLPANQNTLAQTARSKTKEIANESKSTPDPSQAARQMIASL